MKYRTLGQGLEVSAIGIGCMPMIKGGNILISVHTDDHDECVRARDIFEKEGAEDIRTTGETKPL